MQALAWNPKDTLHAWPSTTKEGESVRWMSYTYISRSHVTYKCEYTPGIRALIKESGSEFNHLSGFHSYESDPHISGLRLHPMMDTNTSVPLGIGIAWISFPFIPLIGTARGNTISRTTLCQWHWIKQKWKSMHSDYLLSTERWYRRVSGCRSSRQSTECWKGNITSYSRSVSRQIASR